MIWRQMEYPQVPLECGWGDPEAHHGYLETLSPYIHGEN
jgi:hypothetical protein